MTKQALKEYEEIKNNSIEFIEKTLKVTFMGYDNGLKAYRFRVPGEWLTLNLDRNIMVQLHTNSK